MVGLERCVAAWPELRSNDIGNFVLSIVARIQVHADRIDIMLNPVYPNRNLCHTSTRVRRVLSLESFLPRQKFGCDIGDVGTTKVRP